MLGHTQSSPGLQVGHAWYKYSHHDQFQATSCLITSLRSLANLYKSIPAHHRKISLSRRATQACCHGDDRGIEQKAQIYKSILNVCLGDVCHFLLTKANQIVDISVKGGIKSLCFWKEDPSKSHGKGFRCRFRVIIVMYHTGGSHILFKESTFYIHLLILKMRQKCQKCLYSLTIYILNIQHHLPDSLFLEKSVCLNFTLYQQTYSVTDMSLCACKQVQK